MWLGVDPGGKSAFGIALLDEAGTVRSTCVSCAEEALGGFSSDRLADQWLRKTYRIKAEPVQAANSLRGAALVQGALFVDGLRRRYPEFLSRKLTQKRFSTLLGDGNPLAVATYSGLISITSIRATH